MIGKIKNMFLSLSNRHYFKKKYGADVRSPFVSRSVEFGYECQVAKNVFIGPEVKVGNCTYFNSGPFSSITVESGTKIGSYCSIAPNVFIGPGNHPINLLTTHPLLFDDFWKKKFNLTEKELPKIKRPGEKVEVVIGNDVWIGTGVIITDGVTIGDGTVIAAGSIVTKDIPSYSVVGGIPAKIIKERFPKETVEKLELSRDKWWDWSPETINHNIELFYNVDEYLKYVNKISE